MFQKSDSETGSLNTQKIKSLQCWQGFYPPYYFGGFLEVVFKLHYF